MGLVSETEGTLQLPPPKTDSPPKRPRGRPKGSVNKSKSQDAETKQIEEMLTKALTVPSVAFAFAGDDFCAKHFETQAPVLAKELANASLRYPQWRKYFLLAPSASENLTLFAAIFAFLYAPIAHHVPGVPRIPTLSMVGIPVPPEDEDETFPEVSRERVEAALKEADETGQVLTPEAEELIRANDLGEILDNWKASKAEQPQGSGASTVDDAPLV